MKRTKIDLVLGEAREMDYSAAAMTSADRLATTPAAGELVLDTTDSLLYVGDGATPGGVLVGGTDGGSITAGYRLSFSGTTLNVDRYMPIETVDVSGASPSVTMQAGHAYFINAQSKAVTLNTETIPDDHFGLEGHLEIFVSGTGYVVTGTNVVLSQALEPDAVNNCTVRFHDGKAIISVEDHIAGYVVINGSTSGTGSLYYGISTASEKFIAFNDTLAGTVISLAGATANDEKHLVGNGYQDTILTGAIDCGANKVTVANLALSDVQVTGGTMTFGDAFIPSGSTVAVSGGGLAIEKVTGDGGVIDLGGTSNYIPVTKNAVFSGVTVTGYSIGVSLERAAIVCSASYGTAVATITGCTFTGNSGDYGNAVAVLGTGSAVMVDCTVEGNNGLMPLYSNDGSLIIRGGTINGNIGMKQPPASVQFSDNTKFGGAIFARNGSGGSVTLTSGAIVDLTGNTNATPIAPGGGIMFEQGGATVLYSSGAVSGSYMMDNVTLPAGAKLTNTAVVDLGGNNCSSSYVSTMKASGVTFSGGSGTPTASGTFGGAFLGSFDLTGCTFSSCKANRGAAVYGSGTMVDCIITGCTVANDSSGGRYGVVAVATGNTIVMSGCSLVNNVDGNDRAIGIMGGTMSIAECEIDKPINLRFDMAKLEISGENTIYSVDNAAASGSQSIVISSGAIIHLTKSITPNGSITVLTGGCTVNGNAIPAGTYTSIDSNGQPT